MTQERDSSALSIYICAPNAADRNMLSADLERYFEDICCDVTIRVFEECAGLLEEAQSIAPAFAFIDTACHDMPGLSAAKALRSHGYTGQIAFTSANGSGALSCFAVHPAGFFTKPVDYAKLCDMLDWHRSAFTAGLRSVSVVSSRIKVTVYLQDIVSVEACGRSLTMHTKNGDVSTNMALNELESKLSGTSFVRCHRSHMVNLLHAKRVSKKSVITDGGADIPVSAEKAAMTEAAFKEFSGRNRRKAE